MEGGRDAAREGAEDASGLRIEDQVAARVADVELAAEEHGGSTAGPRTRTIVLPQQRPAGGIEVIGLGAAVGDVDAG